MRNVTRTLKMLMSFMIATFVFVSFGFAQQSLLMTESFETGSGTTPPTGWALEQVTGSTLGVSFIATSTYPTISAAYDGTLFARYNSYSISSGSTRLKKTAPLVTTNKSFIMVDFAWYEDPGYSSSADQVDVQWSTNGTTWNTAGTFPRYNAVAGWKVKNVVLPAGASNQATLYVGFLFTSAWGNNCAMDLVHVTAGPPPPPAFATIGTGTTSSGYPYSTYWMGGRTQMLFTAAELTAAGVPAGNINSLSFNVISNSTQVMNGFNLKVGATALTNLTGGYVNGLTAYNTNPYTVPGTGWQAVNLTTPFVWNGTSNVIFEICYANTAYTTYSYVNATANAGMTAGYYTDSQTLCTTTTNNAPAARPNIRLDIPPVPYGAQMGYVKDGNTSLPIAGAIVQIGAKRDTSRANGFYIIYNLAAGTANYTCTALGYVASSGSTTIVGNVATSQDIVMLPGPKVSGVVTDASNGNPIVGASVSIGTYTTLTVAGGYYMTDGLDVVGAQTLTIGKTGYDNFSTTVTLVANTTTLQDAQLLPTAVAPGPFTATLNNPTTPTAVNLNWGIPAGMYQIIYDDGLQDNFAIWANANNLNAMKFTAAGYPVKLVGGKVYLGKASNYPSNALPLAKFMMYVYKADGTGGVPGTKMDSVEVTPAGFGWANFTFPIPITFTNGDFFLVMKQGGIPPHAAGVGVDENNPQLRSYSKFVTGGAPWIPASGNFMIRAIVQGTGGPMLADAPVSSNTIEATSVPGLTYEKPIASVSGTEGVGRTEPIEWSTMNVNVTPMESGLTTYNGPASPMSDVGVSDPSYVGGVVPVTDAPEATLYDNGPMVNSPGTGAGGADESMLQGPINSYGMNMIKGTYRIADDFSVSGGIWNVTSLEFYGYQTNSPTTSSFTGAYVRIFQGTPGGAVTTVWGDNTTNRLSSTSFTNIYRVSVTGNAARPIMKIVVNTPGLTLQPGSYWIEFSATGSLASGPWCPPITINNQPTTGNALIYDEASSTYVPYEVGASAPYYAQGVPFKLSGTVTPIVSNLSYQVWRLLQGQEGNQTLWNSLATVTTNSTTDNSWQTLPNGPYRWAVKAIYSPPLPARFSAPTFSNVLGKGWTTEVDVCINLTCAVNPKAGTLVQLINVDYPDTNYTKTTDTSGCVHFTNIWKGNYQLKVTRFTYPVYTQGPISILAPQVLNVNLLQTAQPVTNLLVNAQSLKASWSPPRAVVYQMDEPFANFTANQWVLNGANWLIRSTRGNPAPCAEFYYSPTVVGYDQTLTSKSLAGVHAPQMKLKYDILLDNYGTTTVNTMAVELWNGTSWSVLKTYTNANGSFPFTSETLDITSQTHNPAFKIRFHANGGDLNDINWWDIDNVKIMSTDGSTGPNPCVIGYNFYLNNVLSAFTPDTTYNIPPNQVVYGQTYTACVRSVFGSGYSVPVCTTFVAHFLYPARDLTATGIECNAYLTWKKPVTMGDNPQILSMTPRTEFPNPSVDISPYILTMKENQNNNDNSDALWDILFGWSCSGVGQAGVEMIGDFVYTTSWSVGPPWFFKYQATTGALIESFSIPGVTAIRDLAYDGTQYMYGGSNASSIYKMDFTAKTLVATIPTSIPGVRHIAYDAVNNGFWVGGWYDIALVNATTGATMATGPAVESIYGSAWENQTPGGPFLWLHSQTASGTADEYQKWKVTGTVLSNTGIVHNNMGGNVNNSAGGLGCGQVGTKLALIGLNQNSTANWVWATEIGDYSGPSGGEPAGLIGYNIYRDGAFTHEVHGKDTLSWYDYALNPGSYKYDVMAKYDLTPYGFPGQFGESLGNTAGVKTAVLECGYPLPFYEPWDGGSFAYNAWSFAPSQGHWFMNTGIGNPAPSADFHWDPAILNYSSALISPVINATAWTCATIWADFDLKLIDRNNTGKEKLTVDIFYNGGWHQKAEYVNNGSTNWLPKHIDITSVKGKSFRIRFVASGEKSEDILHWYVDNVHLYGICKAPVSLAKTQSHFTTTLTWTAPTCGGGGGTLVDYIFDDGSAENGYCSNPGYVLWLGTEFPLSATTEGVLKSFKLYFMANGSAGASQPTVDIYNSAKVLIGSTGPFTPSTDDWVTVTVPDVPFMGTFYAMVKWNNFSGQTNYLGYDSNGPYAAQDLEWYYDGTAWDKMSNPSIAGELPGVFMIRATALVGGDLKAVELVPGSPVEKGKAKGNPGMFSKANRTADSHDYSVMTIQTDVSDSSQLIGYNVYRTNETGTGVFNKLNASPVTVTTYVDTYPSTLAIGDFKYYVTTLFNDSKTSLLLCESPSDTISVHFPAVGINDLSKGQIMIYPNPASEFVNVKSDFNINRIDVMNFVGQTVYSNSNVEAKTAKINVVTFTPGVYFVKISTTEGNRTVKITIAR